MPTLFDPTARARVLERLSRLQPDAAPQWGSLSPARMLGHAADAMKAGYGEITAEPVRGPMARRPLNWLLIHVLPWPKGKAQSPPEFLTRDPADFEAERAAVAALVERFDGLDPSGPFPPSPVFGAITGKDWGVLAYRHLDHHLRQFGC